MKVLVLLCLAAVMPSQGGPAPTPLIPSPGMMADFIPTPEEIAALQALHTKPAPGVVPTPPVGPTTMPPAVARLKAKYKAAAASFNPSTASPDV